MDGKESFLHRLEDVCEGLHIEGRLTEADETHAHRRRVHPWVLGQQLADLRNEVAELVRRGFIAQVQSVPEEEPVSDSTWMFLLSNLIFCLKFYYFSL
ncbi:MAG: hypothetical protein ABSB79_11830 [Syntrophales bacterium]